MKPIPAPPAIVYVLCALCLLQSACTPPPVRHSITKAGLKPRYHYQVDLTGDPARGIPVSLYVEGLDSRNQLLAFAGVGAFAGSDFRRLVRDIRAYDAGGQPVPIHNLDRSRWLLPQPQQIRRIDYIALPTWDNPAGKEVFPIAGTAFREGFAFLNGKGLFALIGGLENAPCEIELLLPEQWDINTSLRSTSSGSLLAPTLSAALSSPVLAGKISQTTERIMGSDVYIGCYSRSGKIHSDDLLPLVSEVLQATYNFMGELPIDDYTMNFVFDDRNAGGVEFYNSSAFVFRDEDLDALRSRLRDVIAHEYFHLFIPFSIRSDALDDANLFAAQPSGHLWFFEGVTEWASDMLQIQAGLKPVHQYFQRDFREKLFQEDSRNSAVSLYDMSRQRQRDPEEYLSVYSRGALVAALLDILLIERTFGKRSLRDVLRDLHLDFGKERPLPEERFFDILTKYSGPEFADFIQSYIIGNEPLPVPEYLLKLGIRYREQQLAAENLGDTGFIVLPVEDIPEVVWLDSRLDEMGLRRGDQLLKIDDTVITLQNFGTQLDRLRNSSITIPYRLDIRRGGKSLQLEMQTIRLAYRHVLELPRKLSPQQERIYRRWRGEAH